VSVKVVNDQTAGDLPENYERVSWAQALVAVECNLLLEDLIAVKKKKELEALQRILNFNAHHHQLPYVILIAHSATSNGIFPILGRLTHICFMTSQSTSAHITAVMDNLKVCKANRDEKLAAFQEDLKLAGKHNYWVYDLTTGEFGRQPGTLAKPQFASTSDFAFAPTPNPRPSAAELRATALIPYRKTAETYLTLFSEDGKKSMAIFDYLMAKTPLHPLNRSDLNFTLRDAKTGKVVRVSLLDYIHTLTTQTPPTKDVLDLHTYMKKHVTLPRCFIANQHRKLGGAPAPAASATSAAAFPSVWR
jgi:hypothetical protein